MGVQPCVTLRPAGFNFVLHEGVCGQVLVAEVELHLLHDRRPRLVGKILRGGWSPTDHTRWARPMMTQRRSIKNETDRTGQQTARPTDATDRMRRRRWTQQTDRTTRPTDRPTGAKQKNETDRRHRQRKKTDRCNRRGRAHAPRVVGSQTPGEGTTADESGARGRR